MSKSGANIFTHTQFGGCDDFFLCSATAAWKNDVCESVQSHIQIHPYTHKLTNINLENRPFRHSFLCISSSSSLFFFCASVARFVPCCCCCCCCWLFFPFPSGKPSTYHHVYVCGSKSSNGLLILKLKPWASTSYYTMLLVDMVCVEHARAFEVKCCEMLF